MPIDLGIVTDEFERHWKNKEYEEALFLYYYAAKPFWLTYRVAYYYERKGEVGKAMGEYQHLVNVYFEIDKDFLPLPNGPPELYKLGRWYALRDKAWARKYLELYLSAEAKCGRDPAFYLPYKTAAKRILNKL